MGHRVSEHRGQQRSLGWDHWGSGTQRENQGLETGGDVPEDTPCRSCDCHIMVSQSTFLCQNYSPSKLDMWELRSLQHDSTKGSVPRRARA